MPHPKKQRIKRIKSWAVIDRETNELETFDGRPAIFMSAASPMFVMENFIIHSGKVVSCEIKINL